MEGTPAGDSMARVKAFRGIYYQDQAGAISGLVAPPYDVLSVEEADRFREQSPHNVARITVSRRGDPGFYWNAGRLFESWLQDGILSRAEKPGIYFYEIEFDYTLGGEIRKARRSGFFALLGLADYSQGEVLRHERTLKGPKLDQFNLLSAARANLSPIFCLYSDPRMKLMIELARAKKAKPIFDFEFSGFRHRLFGIDDPRLVSKVSAALLKEKVYIADGHHRYETALEYYHRLCFAKDPLRESAGYVMSFFCAQEDPGLVIFPYHRLVRHLAEERLVDLMDRLKEDFRIEPVSDHFSKENADRVFQELDATGNQRAMVLVDAQKRAFLLKLKAALADARENLLDVEILEDLILKRILRISKEELAENKFVVYETSEQKLVERMRTEIFQLVFLMKPIPVVKMVERALRGEVMPEKSTYFYPKLPSGMLFRKIDPGPELS